MEALKLSVNRTSQPVELENEDGSVSRYLLREMTGTLRDQFLNAQRRIMEPTKNGGHTVKDFNGSQSSLLCRCLYDSDGKAVPEATIQGWPVGVQAVLHEAAQKINRLDRIGSTNAMQRIFVLLAQPDMDDEEKLQAIRQTVEAWRKGNEDPTQGES